MRCIILTILFGFIPFLAVAQENQSFGLFSKFEEGKVYLKIQPLEGSAWYLGKSNGYVIERRDVGSESAFQKITESPLLPLPAGEMEALSGDFPFVGELKAILYDMETGAQVDETNFAAVEAKEEELEGRLFLHFYLSAMSEAASEASGLQFVDHSAEAGRSYEYRVRIAGEDQYSNQKVVNTFRETTYTIPELNLTGLDKAVRINWYHKSFKKKYIAYRLERSENGQDWDYLGSSPIVYNRRVSEDSEDLESGYIYEGDSLSANYQPYYYRLTAMDFFGYSAGPGQRYDVMGRDLEPPVQPSDVEAGYSPREGMYITWDYPDGARVDDLDGFFIGTGASPEGPFEPLNKKVLPPDTRSFVHSEPNQGGRNFYIVTAIDTSGNYKHSLPVYEIIPDSLPPASPRELAGVIDSSGVVELHWTKGEEADLMGYRVFRANTRDHEYVQLTQEPLQDTLYTDSISLKTLTKHVFYKIVAVDNNFNHSGFSAPLKLYRPDIMPPVAPKIKQAHWGDGTVRVTWVPGTSRDAQADILLRQTNGLWDEVGVFEDGEVAFTDSFPSSQEYVQYAMLSRDESGLLSDTSQVRTVRMVQFYEVEPVDDLNAIFNMENRQVELSWNYGGNEEVYYIIFRGDEEKSIRMYDTSSGEKQSFSDKLLQAGQKYSYAVRVKRRDGKTSPLSENVEVVVPQGN
ncbi:fibronectin type III domain-containing protein [Marinilabilia salmonicolor]|uniref:fibronectin type III domain-containing protein n=1 Tax=Marinilabilia salmonicolor TaxID=989 RepID=UPI00029A96F3|nr:fibronectin type III domain-containing protein [Marinilabilia salmonicolor]